MAKYQIETENGIFEIETEDSQSEKLSKMGVDPSVVNVQKQKEQLQMEGKDLPLTLRPTQEAFNVLGERTAEKLGGIGINPYVAAATGFGVSEIPTAATGAFLAGPMGKTASLLKRTPKASTEQLLSSARVLKAEAPVQAGRQADILTKMLNESKKRLGELEKAAGLEMTTIPKPPKDISSFAEALKGISNRKAEDLVQTMDVSGLQNLKKIAQVTKRSDLLPEQMAFINKGVERIDEAIGLARPELAEELSTFRQITDALADIGPRLSKTTAARKSQIVKLAEQAKKEGSFVKDAIKLGLRVAGIRK